jgi:hypothetical protein
MTGVIVRILLRYGAGFLVAKGLLSPEDGSTFAVDPDLAQMLEVGIGLAVGAATELYYTLAKKWGWAT